MEHSHGQVGSHPERTPRRGEVIWLPEEARIVITQEVFDRLSADQKAVIRACLAAEEAAK